MVSVNNNIDIVNLESVLEPYIDKHKEIVDRRISCLTAPGDNYGSIMLKVDVTVQKRNNCQQKKFSVVAKIIPDSEYFQNIFNIQVTFKNEIAFYKTIVPTLKEFKRKNGITKDGDLFPRYYGSRINLKGDCGSVDKDGVLLLENLKTKGFTNIRRHDGFDLKMTNLILRNLAEFHAVPLALKLRDPEVFQEKVKAYCACLHPSRKIDTSSGGTVEILKEKDHLRPILPKIRKSLNLMLEIPKNFREPFSTIVHRDMWVNNIMVKFKDGKPVSAKYVDFQMYSYDSPVKDLLFFLITSVRTDLLKKYFDEFLLYYHRCFIGHLKDLNCDNGPFSYSHMLEEIAATLEDEIGHILFMMLFIVLAKEGGVDPNQENGKWDNPDRVPLEGKERAWWFAEECMKRKFL